MFYGFIDQLENDLTHILKITVFELFQFKNV